MIDARVYKYPMCDTIINRDLNASINIRNFALRTIISNFKNTIDKPDKIENAISNVVSDLEKRDFVPVHLEVNWHPLGKTYVVYAKGIDRTKLGSLVGNVQEN